MNHVPVAIIGAGPAGLTLAHLLHLQGIESVVFESRSRRDVEETVRAGILEQGTLNLMRETGVGERMEREADHDEAIDIAINNENIRIPLTELTGHKVAIYPQHEYLKDFIAKRIEDGGELLFETTVDSVEDFEGDARENKARITYTGVDGATQQLTADYVIAADGSNSPDGFALISTRSDTVQRYYLQCNPDDTPEMWSDDRIWEQLHLRADSPGITVSEGRIFDKAVLRFRSAVTEPMQKGRLFLAGDAAHTVPPTGAKGLNLAVADVSVLAPALTRAIKRNDTGLLDDYTRLAGPRIWKAQHFSYWMSSMLHAVPGEDHFATQRRFAELRSVLDSEAGQRYLAEQYVGRDLPRFDY